jgi:colanic acid biosynthesis glycosyl transferase WcaI
MKILFLGINYAPERTSVAPFNTGLCEHFAAQGHNVTVITAFPYYPEWRVWDGYRGKVYSRQTINNVDVRRVWHIVPRRASSLVQRLAHDFSFSFTALCAGFLVGRYDVVCCSSPPPGLALTAFLLARLRGKPYIIKLTDLASDAALATGIIKANCLLRAARFIEAFVYAKADKVVCLCQGFIEKLVFRGLSREKLPLISDWGDTERICPGASGNLFREASGLLSSDFVVLHAGNMGKKQDLMNVVRAAELARVHASIIWMIVGEGEERPAIEEEIARRKLKNLKLLPLQPAEVLREMYSSADVLLLNQKAAIQDAFIPSKLLTYLAAGRAVAAAVSGESESARLIGSAGCGVVVEPENPEALVTAVLGLRSDPQYRKMCGQNGRAYAEMHFTRARVLRQYEALLSRYVKHGPARPAIPGKQVAAGASE